MKRSSKRNAKRKLAQAQTFDPEDFDVNELGHFKRSKIWPVTQKERPINVKKDWKAIQSNARKMQKNAGQKSIFVTIFSNLLLPGLGNVYIQKNALTIAIFFTSLISVLLTFSPVFPIVQILQAVDAVPSPAYANTVITFFVAENVQTSASTLIGPSISFLIFPFVLSWIHLAYLFFKHQHDWNWKF
ncbi:MAG: hypothetical protein IPJ89_04145 [Candidatus Iainarchaeum archaeon]|uniref:Uncharacterized protein n=1 Tax=Candidatus Iainarchaeum sp. TaxID=3101447 RepID=A0A7T9DJ59_9ARCH|nr:MAG: hypothetical protein IPJ89_04145 [Candidatus Diapherotrites archaeon]